MYVDTKETTSFLDLTKPSLAALSHVLRRRHLWPEDFIWHFTSCKTCAMGLAAHLWNTTKLASIEGIALAGIMPPRDAAFIFAGYAYKCRPSKVTPEMVADKIDEYLARPQP